ncbi:cell wall protein DAN4-like isoform X3 [Pomacea canaliculata]|uniref:cell wall protein DAN4-like isoform X3 n=1 Tax=Pomacea canaliculata TaxID=400727 RepID=UPI000D734195|nr:cell wall protein DAN4-like isoform X3 [Pomacea canaliculata]
MSSADPGLCNLARARSCVGQLQETVDLASRDQDTLVSVCIASVKGDLLLECFNNQTAGCGVNNRELVVAREMLDKVNNDARITCENACPSYQHAFWCAGILANTSRPLSQLCRYHEAALQCVTCPLARDMLVQLLKQNLSPDGQNVCEWKCQELHLVLLSLEYCAQKYSWTPTNYTCMQVWDVTSCLESKVEGLQCDDIGQLADRLIPGLTSAQNQCATTTATTTMITTPTTTTTMMPATSTPLTPTTPSNTTKSPTTTTIPSTTTTSPTSTTPSATTTPPTTTMSTTTTTTTPSTTSNPMTTPSTTTTTTPTTTSATTTTVTTTTIHTTVDLLLLQKSLLQTCLPAKLTTNQPNTSYHSATMNISSCMLQATFHHTHPVGPI